jgi:alkyl hydroperoxide reductase subunit AhpC
LQDIDHFGALNCGTDGFPYPILADEDRKLATSFGMLDPFEIDKSGLPLTARAVFVVDSSHRMRLSLLYPATTGRNFKYVKAKILVLGALNIC